MGSPDVEQSRGTTRTLERGLTLLELISGARDGATLSELAGGSGLDKGTVSRLLATLRHTGWAYRAPNDRRYRLAGKALALSHDYTNHVDLRGVAMPRLAALRDQWGETVHLGQIEGEGVVYIECLEPARPVRVVSTVGERIPTACTAMGRAYLSALAEAELKEAVRTLRLVKRTAATIITRKRLIVEIRASAARGYAIDAGESNDDVICVGSAVTDVTGHPVGAISVSGPSYRMVDRIPQIGHACHEAATDVSKILGAPERRPATT